MFLLECSYLSVLLFASRLLPPASYVRPPTSHVLPPTSPFLPPTSYLLPPASYLLPPTSYLILLDLLNLPHTQRAVPMGFLRTYLTLLTLTADRALRHAGLPTSYFLPPTSYFLLPTSYFLLLTSYLLPPTSYRGTTRCLRRQCWRSSGRA